MAGEPTYSESMQGPRLAYVVRELRGTVKRPKYEPPLTKAQREADPKARQDNANLRRMTEVEAGFMVFTPTGASYRLTKKQLIRQGFDRPPTILNREAAKDAKTPAGRFLLAIYEKDRVAAYEEMENEVIRHCSGRAGTDLSALVSDYNPDGKLERIAA
jgi:hypothetical protein